MSIAQKIRRLNKVKELVRNTEDHIHTALYPILQVMGYREIDIEEIFLYGQVACIELISNENVEIPISILESSDPVQAAQEYMKSERERLRRLKIAEAMGEYERARERLATLGVDIAPK